MIIVIVTFDNSLMYTQEPVFIQLHGDQDGCDCNQFQGALLNLSVLLEKEVAILDCLYSSLMQEIIFFTNLYKITLIFLHPIEFIYYNDYPGYELISHVSSYFPSLKIIQVIIASTQLL